MKFEAFDVSDSCVDTLDIEFLKGHKQKVEEHAQREGGRSAN